MPFGFGGAVGVGAGPVGGFGSVASSGESVVSATATNFDSSLGRVFGRFRDTAITGRVRLCPATIGSAGKQMAGTGDD